MPRLGIEATKNAVIAALEDIKARDIVAFKTTRISTLFDYVVIASGDSNRQTRALANSVREKLKALGAQVISTEGEQGGEWILVDLGKVVVHIMQPAARQYYNLEELWAPAPRTRATRKSTAA